MSAVELDAVLHELEQRRKALLRNVALAFVVPMVLGLVIGLVPIHWPSLTLFGVRFGVHHLVSVLLGLGVAYWVSVDAASDYRADFKSQVVASLVKSVNPNLTYTQGGTLLCHQFNDSGLFPHTADDFNVEDHIHGMIGSTRIDGCEVHARYKTQDKNGNDEYHDIFRGLFFAADFNKHLRGHTRVLPDNIESVLETAALAVLTFGRAQPGALVKLEDPEFEKCFRVYSSDEVEARYILSPSFMQRLVTFRQRVGDDITLSFKDSSVFIAIPHRGQLTSLPTTFSLHKFEPRWFRTIVDPALINSIREDISLVVALVEDLNLNTRIWTKV